jgi:hypothetical protein
MSVTWLAKPYSQPSDSARACRQGRRTKSPPSQRALRDKTDVFAATTSSRRATLTGRRPLRRRSARRSRSLSHRDDHRRHALVLRDNLPHRDSATHGGIEFPRCQRREHRRAELLIVCANDVRRSGFRLARRVDDELQVHRIARRPGSCRPEIRTNVRREQTRGAVDGAIAVDGAAAGNEDGITFEKRTRRTGRAFAVRARACGGGDDDSCDGEHNLTKRHERNSREYRTPPRRRENERISITKFSRVLYD